MEVSTIIVGVLSLILAIIIHGHLHNMINNHVIDEMQNKRLLSSASKNNRVDCEKLRTDLLHYCREKDVYQVRAFYQLYLDRCLSNKKQHIQNMTRTFFEEFLDSFLDDEEKEIERVTRKNTQSNKKNVPNLVVDNISSVEDDKVDKDDILRPPPPSPKNVNITLSPDRRMKKQVQINIEPEIKLIERRKRKKKIIIDEPID